MRRLPLAAQRWGGKSFFCQTSRWRPAFTAASPVHSRFCSCSAQQETKTPDIKPAATASADHRALGTAQDLFTNSIYSPGSPLFRPNGTHILNKLISFLRAQYRQYGFREVLTPNIYKQSLWEVSGHWQNYKDDMYEVGGRGDTGDSTENETYGLKPMNCPGHCLLFKSQKHSYRELPVRYADFSPLHRNEVSGSLSGLTRVRRFHQDDGHIFCRPGQIGSEIQLALKFADTVLQTFGLADGYRLVLSTRPEKDFIGSLEQWENAEQQLRQALDNSGLSWELNEGDGAFYGPKIDLQIQDSQGKYHQLSTIQLDMNLPQRFGLEYLVPEGSEEYDPATGGRATPVLIHRAIFGSLERFFALLIERYNGQWPFWLSPHQAILLTVGKGLEQAAEDVVAKVSGFEPITSTHPSSTGLPLSPLQPTFNVDLDLASRSLPKKIHDAHAARYNLVFIMGPKNLAEGSVDIDLSGQIGGKTEDEIKALLDGIPCWDISLSAKPGERTTAKMKMKVDDVHAWLVDLERRFL
ncbi:threonyl-tRNA synthetase [Nannizzia gypsea CBS 118893]|uniref:threonine--tRNA ligase n=1 Tax=Arthroderma gypseum (strain ATCC MYA-4604 / CBS 118893) TaxID=535722 RepID=E4V258_ARTGP|nr:threonyl-tRNA synthetase [Nannizzia gypsea CBS 118893]EFR04123.1 threonyl-tRNA synthetase [Nannizzia gypsea CBS 118893]